MIALSREDWFELSEACLDDSAGAIDDPDFDVVIAGEQVRLTFASPAAETYFRLRWLNHSDNITDQT
jgi:hypothetical protein